VGPPSWGRTDLGPAGALREDGRLHLLGHRSDGELRWLYENAAVVLCPSRLEGFGLPVVEAEGFGAPVVVSDDAALGEVSGPGTVRISSLDPEAWTAAIACALDSAPAPHRSSVAPRTWHDVAAETIEVVRRVA
jgi:glycosyltransferase involved in cell wall biosynthesis